MIDYAEFVVQSTISRFRFVAGVEVYGGTIDIVTIPRKHGSSRVRRKPRSSSADDR